MTMSSKKAFDTNYTSNPVFFPEELCIIGGKCLPKNEQGPLDTAHKQGEHDLWDKRLETVVVTDDQVANVDHYGVLQNPIIRKDPETGIPMVVAGRGRIRRARRANLLRAARGVPLIEITCSIERPSKDDPTRLIGVMIAENAVRDDDGPLVKLDKAKRLLASGVSEKNAAMTFGLDLEYFRLLLAYDDTATDEVKAAVSAGEMSATAGVALVQTAKSGEAQNKALANVREKAKSGKPTTVRDATEAAKRATGKIAEDGTGLIPSRRELGHVLKTIAKHTGEIADEARVLIDDEDGKSGITVEQRHTVDAFYVGVEAAFKLFFGKCDDATLLGMLSKARKELAK
jgi:ParB family chromosome partitioning protein